jgi:hypothetical protein
LPSGIAWVDRKPTVLAKIGGLPKAVAAIHGFFGRAWKARRSKVRRRTSFNRLELIAEFLTHATSAPLLRYPSLPGLDPVVGMVGRLVGGAANAGMG